MPLRIRLLRLISRSRSEAGSCDSQAWKLGGPSPAGSTTNCRRLPLYVGLSLSQWLQEYLRNRVQPALLRANSSTIEGQDLDCEFAVGRAQLQHLHRLLLPIWSCQPIANIGSHLALAFCLKVVQQGGGSGIAPLGSIPAHAPSSVSTGLVPGRPASAHGTRVAMPIAPRIHPCAIDKLA